MPDRHLITKDLIQQLCEVAIEAGDSIMEIYGDRIDSIFSDLESAAKVRSGSSGQTRDAMVVFEAGNSPFLGFVEGVSASISLYLACKRELCV